jgi:hypothetical protein
LNQAFVESGLHVGTESSNGKEKANTSFFGKEELIAPSYN